MATLRYDMTIILTPKRIPVRVGTKLHAGFTALSECDGKSYGYFRSLAGGPVGSTKRRFSPSTVIKLAQSTGFARLEGIALAALAPKAVEKSYSPVTAPDGSAEVGANGPALNAVRRLVVPDGLSLDRPGIYAWIIEGGAVYFGRYTRKSRPLKEYDKNVRRIFLNEPYRPRKPGGFRRIHHALAEAVRDGRDIELRILENCSPGNLNCRERHWIASEARGELNR